MTLFQIFNDCQRLQSLEENLLTIFRTTDVVLCVPRTFNSYLFKICDKEFYACMIYIYDYIEFAICATYVYKRNIKKMFTNKIVMLLYLFKKGDSRDRVFNSWRLINFKTVLLYGVKLLGYIVGKMPTFTDVNNKYFNNGNFV